MKKIDYNPFDLGPLSRSIPTTSAQREILASIEMDQNATLCYNESLLITLDGNLDQAHFNLAFQELLRIHDSLRTVFSKDGKYFFIKEYTIEVVKFLNCKDLKKDYLEEFKRNEVLHKFNLFDGPLYKATLFKIEENKHIFIFTAHHLICDGWSFSILLEELSHFYNSILNNKPLEKKITYQFSDFALEEYKNGFSNADKDFWINEFSKPLISNNFPLDFSRQSFRTFNSKRLDVTVSKETVVKLKKLGTTNGISLYNTLMSLFNILIFQLSKSDEVIVGMASATQSALGKKNLTGHLVNLLPLKINFSQDLPLIEFMKLIRSKMLDAFEHQFFSYGHIVRSLSNFERISGETPLFNIVFNIDQQSPNQSLDFQDIVSSLNIIPREFENFDIFFNVVSFGDSLSFECQYNKNLFLESTIKNWVESFIELIELAINSPKSSIKSFTIPSLYFPEKKIAFQQKIDSKDSFKFKRNIDIENRLIKIWSSILLVSKLDLNDNFFELGGHSLLAIEIASIIRDEFTIPFTIKDVFENPTISALAQKIINNLSFEKNTLPKLIKTGITKFKLSNNQQQIWFLEEVNPNTSMFVVPSTLRLKTKIDRKILEDTIHLIIERHPSLRTSLQEVEGALTQEIFQPSEPRFKPFLEMVETSEDFIGKLISEEVKTPFIKGISPLFKVKLYKLSEDDFVIFTLIHHSVWDGWCFDIYFEEIDRIYSALLKNKIHCLEKASEYSYIDYTIWLNSLVDGGFLQKEESYWVKKLEGPLPVLELPLDFKRPKIFSHNGSSFRFSLAQNQVLLIKEFSRLNKTSQFNVFLTAFKVTLARFSNLNDIIVGLPVRGRDLNELLDTIGFYVNTLALRTTIDLDLSFEENLKSVSTTALEAFDNQLLPFQVVLNKINFQRDSSRNPVFQSFFSYQDVSHRSKKINGFPYTHLGIEKAAVHSDIDLWIRASDERIDGGFEFNSDIFNITSIERFYECFELVLNGLISNANISLNKLRTIPLKQESLIINKWNDNKKAFFDFSSINKMFEAMASQCPHSTAIQTSSEQITFKELNELSNQYANCLVQKGVGPGDLIGVSIFRNINLLAALLGVLKSGAGYVPLDPSFPQDRLDYMIESSNLKYLITENSLKDRFLNKCETIFLSEMCNYSMTNPLDVLQSPEDTMYVIYTSGSSGKPKGVQVAHSSVRNFLLSMKDIFNFNKSDMVLAVTTLSFDIAVLELFLPLCFGAQIFLASHEESSNGDSLKKILDTNLITLMQATPSTWRLLLASGWKGNKLMKLLCGGEAFPVDLAKKLIPINESVWNMYGPTETTVWSACKKLELENEFITIGKAISNTSLYILSRDLKMVPIGATGELYISGDGLAKGYFGRPDLTNEKFIIDPYNSNKRMYATGDLARFTFDGEVECLGRNDGQIKLRGFRIELGEIEHQILNIPEIEEAVVVINEYRPGDFRIFSYVSTKNDVIISDKSIREFLSRKLPAYMIPSSFMFLNQIPKTQNGKVDKNSLPKFNQLSRSDLISEQTIEKKGDENPKETLRKLWQEILGISPIRDFDNFFNLGGNSMLAVELFSKVKKTFSINLQLSSLVEAENFGSFAKFLDDKILKSLPQADLVINESSLSVPLLFKSLVAIKPSGTSNPMFCFHGAGGNILNYISLLPAISKERPLLAIQSIGLDGKTDPLLSIESMASSYVREIKMAQPIGPYLLAGGSMGGVVAFEVALQLQKSGEKIEKLVMFDTFGPKFDLKFYNINRKFDLYSKIRNSLNYRTKILFNSIQVNFFRRLGLNVPMTILLTEIERKNYLALWKYKPAQQFKGELHLVRSTPRSQGWYSDPVMGWGDSINGNINTFEIKSSHENFIESPELIKVLEKII